MGRARDQEMLWGERKKRGIGKKGKPGKKAKRGQRLGGNRISFRRKNGIIRGATSGGGKPAIDGRNPEIGEKWNETTHNSKGDRPRGEE